FKTYQGKGQRLSFYPGKENLFCAGFISSNALFATTHAETRTLTGNWNWISFPCMPRLGNNAYSSQALLENLDPLPIYLELITSVEGLFYSLVFEDQVWHTQQLSTLISTQGYKYYSSSSVVQNLPVYGTVLDPTTPIPLNAAYENWIGYFLEYPLDPQDAFAGVWNKLTRISTEHWTLILKDGVIVQGPSLDSPLRYGDGVIVTVKENCTLIWNNDASPGTPVDHPSTDYYTYTKKADYVPFYFEMDSTEGIQEIALMVADSCVGAAVVRPGDSITEVNAYLAGIPSGEPVTVETWSGYKSARLGSTDYSVVDRITQKRVSRTIYTGEQQPYYVISFKSGESARGNAVVVLQPPSPNPFSHSVMCSFVLNEASSVTLSVYDMRGQRVATLMQGSYGEGFYEAAWNGIAHTGKTAPDGIYIIRLTVNDKMIANEKVVLIR
ncbi:MAG: FlgD immunoglobulin-like domain containing protein, partial [Bacteroidales bacterium]|nr:FlgD immunoglobulin-like domain containing protein [Bacteroidales bacterium]